MPKWRPNTFFSWKSKVHRAIVLHFFGRRYDGMKGFPADFRPKFGRKIDIRPEIEKKRKKKFKKNRFFRFFQKLSKSSVNIEFCLKNTLNTSRGQFLHIFHHISQYKPLEKIDFFGRKSWFFEIFEIFWILMMRSIIRPEPAGNVKFGRKWARWTPKILLHTLYVIIWPLEQLLKTRENQNFFSHDFPLLLAFCYHLVTKW